MTRNAPHHVRFWEKVIDAGDCWEWQAATFKGGYGSFCGEGRRTVLAHRWAYEHMIAPIPEGLTVDHLCVNPPCVNPYHMDLVPLSVNVRRQTKPRGENHHNHKLTDDEVAQIRAEYRGRGDGQRLAKKFGVSGQSILRIRKGLARVQ